MSSSSRGVPALDPAATMPSFQLLTATYDSPTNAPFSCRHQIPTPATSDTAHRVAYLGVLRKATAELQVRINEELTQRMEEDKTRNTASTREKNGAVLDEGKDEEYYGEEVVDDE